MAASSPDPRFDGGRHQTPDGFNRRLFARHLADTILGQSRSESGVIGVYGCRGGGKTNLLTHLDEILSKQPEVVLIRYNPWLYSGHGKLYSGHGNLTSDLLTAIFTDEKFFRKSGDLWTSPLSPLMYAYAGTLEQRDRAVPRESGPGTVGNGVSATEQADAQRLPQLKAEIGEYLFMENVRVVVLIDDLDRLTPPEIRQLLGFVATDADFPGVTCVLAFTPGEVAEAVRELEDGSAVLTARQVLAPFFRALLPLPRLDHWALTDHISARLTQVLSDLGVLIPSTNPPIW